MELFYTTNIDGDTAVLEGQESMHCAKVLRHKAGDTIHFTDGKNTLYNAEVKETKSRKTILNITRRQSDVAQRGYYLHMAVALTKNFERYEWFLEKAVETGVDRITPLVCDHNERKVFKYERSQRIILSAMKQSLKYRLPQLDDAMLASEFISSAESGLDATESSSEILKIMGHCREGEKTLLPMLLKEGKEKGVNHIVMMIGPEGDFSVEEISQAVGNNFEIMDLGSSRMRVETAALTSVTAVYLNYL